MNAGAGAGAEKVGERRVDPASGGDRKTDRAAPGAALISINFLEVPANRQMASVTP